ncbi:MAG: FAD-binding oxidoreductase [Burkholderiaceae bacterium]|nr:FAD-binding oxidoreductase [Burkholderiaceae bacterium]
MADVFQIRLEPHGGSFSCAADQTVLDAAIAAGYWLPHSCRAGTCNSCHLTLDAGTVRNAEPAPEGADAVPEGECRTCQAFPLGDLVLHAPTVPQAPGQRVVTAGARVLEVERPSADVAIVRLQVPAASGFRFQAGQYADVLLKDGARRSYSLANVPNEDGLLEWHVRRMDGGRFSPHAYDKLKARDLLRIQGPYGTFVLHDSPAPIVLLASGTGYAPIASLLQTHAEAIAQRGAVLYWGGRQWSDLYAIDSVPAWEARFPGVRLVPVLSEPGADWQGRTGFVHAAVLQDLPDLSGHAVYACGNPLMIDAARAAFTTQGGLPPGHFYCDAFITSKP